MLKSLKRLISIVRKLSPVEIPRLLIDPTGIKGIISIEMPCREVTAAEAATLAKIPILVMFGDHLDDVHGGPANWATSFDGCQKFVDQVKAAGGDAEMMHLPKLGIKGNSHMLMQDKNNLQLADLILTWLDNHVEAKKSAGLHRRGTRSTTTFSGDRD